MKKNYVFYLAAFIVAWVLIILGLVLGYFYAASTIEVAKFEYLPKKVQSLYIKRDEVDKISEYLTIQKSDIISPNKPISSDIKVLQAEVKSLREKNGVLYHDNVNLNDKNWNLISELNRKKDDADKQSKEFLKIKELSNKVSALQKKAIEDKANYDKIVYSLKNKVKQLNIDLQKKEFDIDIIGASATKKQLSADPSLAQKNAFLIKQTKKMQTVLKELYAKNSKVLEDANKKIKKLKSQISQKELNINTLLTKHASKIIDIEQKNSIIVRDLKQKIASLQIQNKKEITIKNREVLKAKKSCEAQLDSLKSKIPSFKERKKQDNSEDINAQSLLLKDKIKSLTLEKKTLELKLEDMEKKIRNITFQKEKDYDDILKKVKKTLASSNDDIQRRTGELESRIFEAASIIDSLKDDNKKLRNKLDKYSRKKLMPIDKFEKIEKKHAKNYRIFNEVVASLEKEKKKLKSKLKEHVFNATKSMQIEIDNLKKKYLEANATLENMGVKMQLLLSENDSLKLIQKSKIDGLASKYKVASGDLNTTSTKLETLSKKFYILQQRNDKLSSENDKLLKSLKSDRADFKARNEKFIKEIAEQRDKIATLEKSLQAAKEESIKLTNKNSTVSKESYEKISTMEKDYKETRKVLIATTKELNDLKSTLKKMQEISQKNQYEANKLLVSKNKKIDLLQNRLKSAGETLKFTQDKLARVKDDKIALEKDISILNKEVDSLKNSNKSNENISKDRLSQLAQERDEKIDIIQQKNNKIIELKKFIKLQNIEHDKIIKDLQAQIDVKDVKKSKSKDILAKYNLVLNDLRNRKAEILSLKNKIQTLTEKQSLTSLKNEEELKDRYDEIFTKLDAKTKELSLLQSEFDVLRQENIKLNEKIRLAKKDSSTIPTIDSLDKPSPLKLLASIKCDDMPAGSNKATSTCKTRVKKFLSKYSARNFYEVVPIVDNGGFSSLKKVQRSKIGVPDSEIERLTRLSNIGLGKDRSSSGGEIIRSVFGDLARISYSNSNEDIPHKRGFVIRVYE